MADARKRKYSYTTRRIIGSGAFADVFLGSIRDDANNVVQKVAVKRIDKSKLSSDPRVDRLLQNEISLLRVLSNHVHIVELLDSFEDSKYLHLVLEYCDGGDLAQHLKKYAPLSEGCTHDMLQQIVEAIKHTRSNHIVHRDIKPQNILLHKCKEYASGFCVKLTDFGFATRLQVGDMATTFCGSPLHMAPELLAGNQYDPKIDLWSLGTIAYQMITGSTPYRAQNIKELKIKLREQASKPLPLPKNTNPDLVDLIQRLLCLDPKSRIDFEELYIHPYILKREHAEQKDCLPLKGGGMNASLLENQGSYVMVDKKVVHFGERLEQIHSRHREEGDDVVQATLRKMAEDVVCRATLVMYVGDASSEWERLALYGHALVMLRDVSIQAQEYLMKSAWHTRKTMAMAFRFRDCMEYCVSKIDEMKETLSKRTTSPKHEETQGITELLYFAAVELEERAQKCPEEISESLHKDAILLLKVAQESCSEPVRKQQIEQFMLSLEKQMNMPTGSVPNTDGDSQFLGSASIKRSISIQPSSNEPSSKCSNSLSILASTPRHRFPPPSAPIDIPARKKPIGMPIDSHGNSYERARFCGGCGLRYAGNADIFCPMCGTQRAMISSSTRLGSLLSL